MSGKGAGKWQSGQDGSWGSWRGGANTPRSGASPGLTPRRLEMVLGDYLSHERPNDAALLQANSNNYLRGRQHEWYGKWGCSAPTLVYHPSRDGRSECQAEVWISGVDPIISSNWLSVMDVIICK